MACVPLGKTTKGNELGLGRFERQTKFLQSFAQGILHTKCIRLILNSVKVSVKGSQHHNGVSKHLD
ncbi:hypothetical protein EBME_1215 [bacterium endosymbiont of Mortierella elongata FMR23-6]|nr:hypothetical protein EBME_1215 [bacterium endosymbiont of Mortierella elongata FMR23-6]